jgi:hypothetical protein
MAIAHNAMIAMNVNGGNKFQPMRMALRMPFDLLCFATTGDDSAILTKS